MAIVTMESVGTYILNRVKIMVNTYTVHPQVCHSNGYTYTVFIHLSTIHSIACFYRVYMLVSRLTTDNCY